MSQDSWLVFAGRLSGCESPMNVPLIAASNFAIASGRQYARDDATPLWESLEFIIGGLEGGRSVTFSSGMAAIASIFDDLRLGCLLALPDDCYQGVASLALTGTAKGCWTVKRIAIEDTEGWKDG